MRPAAEILVLEAAALPPILAAAPSESFELPTVCDGWSVRDVVAHCGSSLGRLVRDELLDFTPEDNQPDVDDRRSWPLRDVIDELLGNYPRAASRIDELGGAADGIGLGEWVHGGDIRDPLGAADAYASTGVDLALGLIGERSRQRSAPGVTVVVDGEPLDFGTGPVIGQVETDAATFVRLVAGRRPDPARFEIAGVEPSDLVLFG